MVFILQRYIFREVFKVFVPAVVALTLMMSLGSVLRPVQEYGVGPQQVVHLMGYFLPITLTFVLPMAALFATSMVYGRFASDNELDACKASGISLLTLVYPGLALAIMVAIANLILSFHVMPAFVHLAEKSLKADAKQILFRNIQRRGYYELPPDGRYRIYADRADLQNNMLSGVIIVELKGQGIEKIITSERAGVHFNPHKRFNEVRITPYNTYQMAAGDGGSFFVEQMSLTTEFGSLLRDNIKFKKVDEMKKIRAEPMRFYPVEKLARQVYAQFTTEILAEDIAGEIVSAPNGLYKLRSDEKIVEFTADGCSVRGERQIGLSGKVVVTESDAAGKRPLRTLRCTRAMLHIEGDELAPTLTMELYNAAWRLALPGGDGLEGLTQRHIIRGLILPEAVTDKFKCADVLESIEAASIASALRAGPSSKLTGLQDTLARKIQRTFVEIKAEMHTRLVFGIGCVSLTLIGLGLGIILKGGHLLSAFGASSAPAAVLIVCIMMGKNITKNPGAHAGSGIILMWAALVFLSVLAAVIIVRLLKN